MHVVIGGFGRVGAYLAHMLERDGHTVAVIDHDMKVLEEYGEEIRGRKLVGEVFDRDTLVKAGIEQAFCFAAVTSGDNSNIVSARLAREHFHVPHVVARIFDPRRAVLYENFGIPTISSVQWSSSVLLAMILQPLIRTDYAYGGGEVLLVEVHADEDTVGKAVRDLGTSGCARVTTIVRNGAAMIAQGSMVIEPDDRIFVNVRRDCLDEMPSYLFGEAGRQRLTREG